MCAMPDAERTSGGGCVGGCQVMVAGGYVVLERPNPALVAAVSARVYTVVAPLADAAPGGAEAAAIEVEVISSQMAQKTTAKMVKTAK